MSVAGCLAESAQVCGTRVEEVLLGGNWPPGPCLTHLVAAYLPVCPFTGKVGERGIFV